MSQKKLTKMAKPHQMWPWPKNSFFVTDRQTDRQSDPYVLPYFERGTQKYLSDTHVFTCQWINSFYIIIFIEVNVSEFVKQLQLCSIFSSSC